jgi:hypothetical protein
MSLAAAAILWVLWSTRVQDHRHESRPRWMGQHVLSQLKRPLRFDEASPVNRVAGQSAVIDVLEESRS